MWSTRELGDPSLVKGDVSMFAGFEPEPPYLPPDAVNLSVGAGSPNPRYEVASAYQAKFGVSSIQLRGARHAVHLEAPRMLAQTVGEIATNIS